MTEETTKDLLTYDEQGKAKIPGGLNVLTILTFIGCAIFGLLTLLTPVINKFFKGFMDKAVNSGQELSAKQLAEIEKGRVAMELASQNMIPLMAIGLVGIILCFVGALWMRKFKKDGYWMYVAGELAPLLGNFLIMGTAQYTSIWSVLIGVGIPLIFVILYTMQRKYLTK
jgi:uncharacterized membrane protein